MKIEIEVRTEYGNRRIYIKDQEIALAITTLTGRKTLQSSDLVALRFLGLEIEGTE